MSHAFRFFAEPVSPTSWRLDAEEAHHLAKVLRVGVGAPVEVTDGQGRWAVGDVVSIGSKEAVVRCDETHSDPVPAVRLAFAVGALKAGRIDDILPALTELGLDAIHVFHQDESAKARVAPKAVERWERILRAAVKQSKRSRIPELTVHESLAAMLTATGSVSALRLVLAPGAAVSVAALLAKTQPTSVLALAGGERGLTDAETSALTTAGFQPARLGPHVLRAVTAAVAAASILAIYREDLPSRG